MASFMSAITLLGVSTEIYTYGTMFVVINFSYGFATAISAWYYLPVFYKLQATSAYEVNNTLLRNTCPHHISRLFLIEFRLHFSIWKSDSVHRHVWSPQ